MLSKLIAVAFSLFMLASCATQGNSGGSYAESTDNASERFRIASQNLEPFELIPGDSTGARAHDRVFFDFDSSVLRETEQQTLKRQAEWLKKNPNVTATIEGHADERGTREYNLALGERRAVAAKNFLVRSGVSASRLKVISYGKERPAVLGSTEDAYAQNRRAVTVVAR